MPQPTGRDIHQDIPLSTIATYYKNDEGNYIADRVLPVVPVDKQSDKYYKWTKDFTLRNKVELRTPGDTYPEMGLELSTDSYFCDIFHLAFAIPDEDRLNQDPAVQLEETGAETLADQFMLNREIKIAADVFATGKWATDKTGGTDFTKWDDYGVSDPFKDINAGRETVEKNTGRMLNTMVISREGFHTLREHPLFVDKFKYTSAGMLSEEQVRSVLDIQNLLIGKAVRNTAAEGATFSGGYIWGKNALLLYVPPAPGIRVPAAGYTFVWNLTGNGMLVSIENTREDNRDRDLLKGKHAFDHKIVSTDLGYFLSTIRD